MNEKNAENKRTEDLLRKAYLPEPSTELKMRITTEAKKTWIQSPSELPWQVPVRRFIISAAAAVLIVWLTNSSSDYVQSFWQSGRPRVTHNRPVDLDVLPELSYSPLAKHLVLSGRKPSITNVSGLQNYPETLRRILNESQQNRSTEQSTPAEGRSILLRKKSGFKLYS